MDALLADTRETHRMLEERLARARVARGSHDPDRPRDQYPPVDTFLATASRHTAATVMVLVPAAKKRLPDGHERAKEYLAQTRAFAQALAQVKAKLYGSVYAVGLSWSQLWDLVEEKYRRVAETELQLAEELGAHLEPDDPDLAQALHRAELRAPTRPHPYIPQQGPAGSLARAIAKRVDAFWDTAEGRMVPEPVRHHDREKDGLFIQYLLGDPHDEEWPAEVTGEASDQPPAQRLETEPPQADRAD